MGAKPTKRGRADVADLARERRLRALDAKARALLAGKPRLAARTRAYLEGGLMAKRKQAGQPDVMLTTRVPFEIMRRADALVPAIAAETDTALVAGRVTRSTVLRLALAEGLKALERKHSGSPFYARERK